GATVRSARCRGDVCVAVHPSPSDSVSVLHASDLSLITRMALPAGSDPRDVALVDQRTAVVSLYGSASLMLVDWISGSQTPIDLGGRADSDGLPEAERLAICGRRVYAQLRRVDHDSGAPAAIPAVLAVIDLDRSGAERVVDADPNTPGVQGITLAD